MTSKVPKNIPALLLAAGASSRLGSPKQLQKFRSKSLIQVAVETCFDAGFKDLHVVLGYRKDDIEKEISVYPITILENGGWQEGMGSSLSFGLSEILKTKSETPDGLLIYLVDQPFIPAPHLENLHKEFLKFEKKVIATGYRGTYGPPLICRNIYFESIIKLRGDIGAKKIFDRFPTDVQAISLAQAGIDIDKKSDLKFLR